MAPEKTADGAPAAEKLGWRLGMQAYTFNRFTFFEAVDKTESLGLRTIEAFPGQTLGAEHGDAAIDHNMSPALFPAVKEKLASAGVKLACYGVVGLSADEAGTRKVFDFAKAAGIETIVTEPDREAFDLLDKLTEEYGITIALHNHPKPSSYWDPDIVLEAIAGHSEMIGSCSDTGHWMRSGLDPLESLKKLEGRIISLHLKDLNKFGGDDCHDVPFGQGQGNIKGCLGELLRQGVEAVFSIEYEHNWDDSVPEIAEGVRYFDDVAAELAG